MPPLCVVFGISLSADLHVWGYTVGEGVELETSGTAVYNFIIFLIICSLLFWYMHVSVCNVCIYMCMHVCMLHHEFTMTSIHEFTFIGE